MLQHILVQMMKRRRMKMKVMMPQKIQHQTAQLLLSNIRYCQLATENPALDSLAAAIKYQVLSVSHRKSSIRQLRCCYQISGIVSQPQKIQHQTAQLLFNIKYQVLSVSYRKFSIRQLSCCYQISGINMDTIQESCMFFYHNTRSLLQNFRIK